MKNFVQRKLSTVLALSAFSLATSLVACNNDDEKNVATEEVKLENHSVTPALVKKLTGFDNLEFYSLFSSEDKLPESPTFVFGGSADGAGLVKHPEGGYVMMVNNEDNWSVARITFDKTFKPVKGEYALNSDAGQWRLCSGTMATPEVNGFGPLYLSTGESSSDARTHGIDPFAKNYIKSQTKELQGLGRWSGENSVPLHKDAFPGKTVIIIGEDADDATGGQVILYVSNSVGDLDYGFQYMLRRVDQNQKETDMIAGTTYDVEFVKIENHKTLLGSQMQALVDPLKAIKFGRVEDLDFRKGSAANAREVYFNVTGQAASGNNTDRSRTVKGRVYKLTFDANDPLKGKLECILDGDVANGIAKDFQNPDNICVTQNYVYIQEDSNGYGTETHDAYIYQYNIATKELKPVMELDHHRTDALSAKFLSASSAKGSWEYGALVDISDVIGVPNTFTLAIQPHSWRTSSFAGADGGNAKKNENQGSQVIVIKNLPR